MKAGQVIALCLICGAAGAQINQGSTLPNGYKPIEYKNVAQGVNSRITTARTDVIQNSQTWQKFYSDMAGDARQGLTPAPVLCDFNRYDLLVIHIGQQRTSGHAVYVSMIRREKPSEVTVDVVIQSPTPQSIVTPQVNSPYVVVVVEKQNVPYNFRSTFGYVNTTYVGGSAQCGCTCGCPQCAGGNGGFRNGNGNANSPFGGDICPPMPRGGRNGSN